jgi:TldD protein
MSNEDLADFAVKHALKLGATYAEARHERSSSNELSLKNGVPQLAGFEDVEGLGVRIIYHGAMEQLSTDWMDKPHVQKLIEDGVRAANANSRLMEKQSLLSSERKEKARYVVKEKKKIANVGIDDKFELIFGVEKALAKAQVPTRFFSLGDDVTAKYYVNSEGASIRSVIPRVGFAYVITVKHNERTRQRHFQWDQVGGYERFDAWKVEESIAAEANALLKMLKEGVEAPREPLDVVCGPEVVGIACHESVGHPYEADRILGREGAQAGESFLTEKDIGKRIGSDAANVVDDPTLEGSAGYFLFDDEGVKARRKALMTNGVVTEFLHNRETGYAMGTDSNGSARAMDFECEPIVRMSNTFLLPGEMKEEELIEGVKKGVYIKSFTEWNIDDKRLNQKYVSSEAYLIENGRLTKPVRKAVLETTTMDFWSSLDAAATNVQYFAGSCGKGEPMQGVPVWMGGPSARLRGMRLGI